MYTFLVCKTLRAGWPFFTPWPKHKMLVDQEATTTTLLRYEVKRGERTNENENWSSGGCLTVCTFLTVSGRTPLRCAWCWWCRWCWWCFLLGVAWWLHSRVRLVDALVVIVGRHGPTAGHHHVIGIDLWIVGIAAAAPYDHIIGIHLHIIVGRRLWRRWWRWRRRGRCRVTQITFNLHVAGQYQFGQIGLKFLHPEDWRSFGIFVVVVVCWLVGWLVAVV